MGFPDLESPTQPTRVDLSESLLWPSRLLWLVLAGLPVLATLIGARARFDHVRTPCADGEDCGLGRWPVEVLQGVTDAGFSVDALSAYLTLFALLMMVLCAVAGFLIFWPRPRTMIAFVASLFLITTACFATFVPLSWGEAWAAGDLFAELFRSLTNLSIVSFFLLFPTGTFRPRGAALVLASWIVYDLSSWILPEAFWSFRALGPGLDQLPVLVAVILAVCFQVLRFQRDSTPVERQQTKWVFYALVLQAVYFGGAVLVAFVWSPSLAADWGPFFLNAGIFHGWFLTFLLIPLSLFFSIQRYRLWEIDLLVHRSLVYAFSTFLVAFGFALLLSVGSALIRLTVGDGYRGIAVGAALLGAGAMFQPCRQAMRGFVDRRFFGIHVDVHRPTPTASAAPEQPFPLTGYSDLRLVGAGGMARVYEAQRDADGRRVAIKVRRWEEDSEEFQRRFEREAQVIGSLEHPNIVRLLDYCVVGERYQAIIMEFVSDKTLRQAMDGQKPLDHRRILELLEGVCKALDYAHERNIVHRDIKPSNVLLANGDQPERAVLTDFGIAKVQGQTRLTVTNPIGTVTHMSPEQIKTPHKVDRRSDVYSLGILAYQLLTGEVPFGGGNATAILIAHLQQPVPDPRHKAPSIPEAAATAIRRALSKRPDERYASAGEFYLGLVGRGSSEAATQVR
ncbi:MAG: protein kinase [Acidobacteriota bacterium]